MVAYNDEDDDTPDLELPTTKVQVEEPFAQAMVEARDALLAIMIKNNIHPSSANGCYLTGILSIMTFRSSPYYKHIQKYKLAAVLYGTALSEIHEDNDQKYINNEGV